MPDRRNAPLTRRPRPACGALCDGRRGDALPICSTGAAAVASDRGGDRARCASATQHLAIKEAGARRRVTAYGAGARFRHNSGDDAYDPFCQRRRRLTSVGQFRAGRMVAMVRACTKRWMGAGVADGRGTTKACCSKPIRTVKGRLPCGTGGAAMRARWPDGARHRSGAELIDLPPGELFKKNALSSGRR